MNPKCPISDKSLEPVFTNRLLGKYDVQYYYCEESGLLQTETPYWLDEAYQEAIADTDTGLVSRNISNRKLLSVVLNLIGWTSGKFLDVSGGYGLLARLMRDNGFDCYTTDKYCKNLFAKSFEPNKNFRADTLLAFEVMEHIEDPFEFINDAFQKYQCKSIVFSTNTFGPEMPPKDWWYYSCETGQHITFYQIRTLKLLAEKLGCHYYPINTNYHIISDQKISKFAQLIISNKLFIFAVSNLTWAKLRRKSKVWEDHLEMVERLKVKK